MGVRKNIRSLTPMEKQRLVSALIQLKATGAYDMYVMTHMNAMHHAHGGPAFLPWHREFLRRLERDLQGIDPSVTLPYWDWTTDNTPSSLPWQADLMGGNGRTSDRQVVDGPFAYPAGHWPINVDSPPNFLTREMGVLTPSLPNASEVAAVLSVTPYDSAPWDETPVNSFRNQIEGWRGPNIHNRVHVWIGGSMYPMSSPNDPVFFLHHCNIDRLWAQWQAAHPAESYQPVTGGPMGHNLNDPMEPWGAPTTVASVLNHQALGYRYDTELFMQPVKKAVDDPQVVIKKIADDPPPVKKAIDDPPVKVKKIADDTFIQKKVKDDPPIKTRASDIPKLPGDVKFGFDDPLELGGWASSLGIGPQLPFALATPHHATAWAGAGQEPASSGLAAAALSREQLAQRTAELEALTEHHRALLAAAEAEQPG